MKLRLASALLTLPFLFSTTSAFAAFHGKYTVVFLEGPSHSETGSECVAFKHTGTILGFWDSGTWTSPTYKGWGGNFIVDHGNLRFYGTFSNGTGVTNFYATVSGATATGKGFDEWYASAPPVSPNTDGTIAMSLGCDAAAVAAAAARPQRSSPSQ